MTADRAQLRALVGFVPHCAILFKRLLGDPRVSLPRKLLLLVVATYLAIPIDLIPDFIPVLGQLDDALVVALGLRSVVRGAGVEVVSEHWPGPATTLRTVIRLAGAQPL